MRAVRIARSVGASLALEEPAGDLARGVHPLLDVDREREEVRSLAGLGPALRGGEHHGAALLHDDCAVGLLGELPVSKLISLSPMVAVRRVAPDSTAMLISLSSLLGPAELRAILRSGAP